MAIPPHLLLVNGPHHKQYRVVQLVVCDVTVGIDIVTILRPFAQQRRLKQVRVLGEYLANFTGDILAYGFV